MWNCCWCLYLSNSVPKEFSELADVLRVGDFAEPLKALNIALDALAIINNLLGAKGFPELIEYLPQGLREKFSRMPNRVWNGLNRLLANRRVSYNTSYIRSLQRSVQSLLSQEKRKRLAAFFTNDPGLKIMKACVREYLATVDRSLVIADPFMGAALTLTEPLRDYIDNIRIVWGIELQPLVALVGYASLLSTFGDPSRVLVFAGDTFDILTNSFLFVQNRFREVVGNTDIILTNPPFTRWENLDKRYRDRLLKIMKSLGYGKYIRRGQTSLHVLGLFLADRVLKRNGMIVSVLPASTFYTIYGEGYKKFLRERYRILSLIESLHSASFSDDSGFKELILVSMKKPEKASCAFISMENRSFEEIYSVIKKLFDGSL